MATLQIAPRHLGHGIVKVERLLYHYSVWEWLDGRPFSYHRDLRRLAGTLAILHRRTRNQRIAPRNAPDLCRFLRGELSKYSRDSARGGGCAEHLHRAAATAQRTLVVDREPGVPVCLVHNDLVAENVVVVEGRARLIDWDWAMNAHPAIDLCGFLSPFATSWRREAALEPSGIATFLRSYLHFLNRTETRIVMRAVIEIWHAHNVVIANWTYRHADQTRRHFRDEGFYRRTFARSAAIWAWLRAQIEGDDQRSDSGRF